MLFDNLQREKVSKREDYLCFFFVPLIEGLLYNQNFRERTPPGPWRSRHFEGYASGKEFGSMPLRPPPQNIPHFKACVISQVHWVQIPVPLMQ
jgi:hypothetical protein